MMSTRAAWRVGLEQEPSGDPAGGTASSAEGLQMAPPEDVFVNVVGGVKVTETSADPRCCWRWFPACATVPSATGTPVVFGEVGLAGEIRPVPSNPRRISEAAKHGFSSGLFRPQMCRKVPKGCKSWREKLGTR